MRSRLNSDAILLVDAIYVAAGAVLAWQTVDAWSFPIGVAFGAVLVSWYQDWQSARGTGAFLGSRLKGFDVVTCLNYVVLARTVTLSDQFGDRPSPKFLAAWAAVFAIYMAWNLQLIRIGIDQRSKRLLRNFTIAEVPIFLTVGGLTFAVATAAPSRTLVGAGVVVVAGLELGLVISWRYVARHR